jgi:hypothetical protein
MDVAPGVGAHLEIERAGLAQGLNGRRDIGGSCLLAERRPKEAERAKNEECCPEDLYGDG